MKSVLVTGGAGYIGSHTVRMLCDLGYDVTVLDNLVYGHREAVDQRARFFKADLLVPENLECVFNSCSIDAVIHFAAFAYVGESVHEPEKYYINNVAGTLNLLKCMRKNKVNNIIFSSTCATYGEATKNPLDETQLQKPINPYGRSKLIIEKILSDYHKSYGLNYIALRYFNAAGCSNDGKLGESHNPETHVIPLVLRSLRNRTKFHIFGTDYETPDGTCIRDYVHVEDLADAHVRAMENVEKFSGCINLGTGTGTSVRQIINAAEDASGLKCPIEEDLRRPGDPSCLTADNSLANKVLGWQPHHSNIREIVTTAWQWEEHRRY